jgi:hypothetical protein
MSDRFDLFPVSKANAYKFKIDKKIMIPEPSGLIRSIDNILGFRNTEADTNNFNKSENITIFARQ